MIACDAYTVYAGMGVLTAAPRAPPDVPHHLVGVRPPSEPWSAAVFAAECDRLVDEIRARGRVPWIAGGTALYLRGWLKGFGARVPRDDPWREEARRMARERGAAHLHALLAAADPARAADLHENDLTRVVRALEIVRATGRPASAQRGEWAGPDRRPAVVFALRREAEDLDERIRRRARALFEEGVVGEVAALLRAGEISPEAGKALGLEAIRRLLQGGVDEEGAREEIVRRTRRFARKQATFFASFAGVSWVEVPPGEAAEATAARILDRLPPQVRGTSA